MNCVVYMNNEPLHEKSAGQARLVPGIVNMAIAFVLVRIMFERHFGTVHS